MTGQVAGDDWDHSSNGCRVSHMKGAFPHHESRWSWGKSMDQAVLKEISD